MAKEPKTHTSRNSTTKTPGSSVDYSDRLNENVTSQPQAPTETGKSKPPPAPSKDD